MCWYRGFEPEWILPISLLSRAQGMLAHWKEAMCKFLLPPPQRWNCRLILRSWLRAHLASRTALHRRPQQED